MHESTNQLSQRTKQHQQENNVMIWEVVSYEIAIVIPEDSAFSWLLLTDSLDSWLQFEWINSIIASWVLTTSLPSFSWASPIVSGQQFTIDFGTVTNNNLDGSNLEMIVVQYDARITNENINQNWSTRNNTATIDREQWAAWSGIAMSSSSDVTIIEPELSLIKSSPTTNSWSSRTIRYTLDIAHTSWSTSDAFDITISDDLISHNMYYVTWSILLVSWTNFDTIVESGWTVSVGYDQLALGESSRLSFDALLGSAISSWQTITNQASARWTSLSWNDNNQRTWNWMSKTTIQQQIVQQQLFRLIQLSTSVLLLLINHQLYDKMWLLEKLLHMR